MIPEIQIHGYRCTAAYTSTDGEEFAAILHLDTEDHDSVEWCEYPPEVQGETLDDIETIMLDAAWKMINGDDDEETKDDRD